jgi:hypothetical protein
MNRGIIISADKLKKNYPKKKIIADIINQLLYKINSSIDLAYKNNEHEIIINLPITFIIPNTINHKEFQLEVYYNIIDILEKKGYLINIKISKNETLLKINWSYENNESIHDMKNKIKSCLF